jgi:hypothetical protein
LIGKDVSKNGIAFSSSSCPSKEWELTVS